MRRLDGDSVSGKCIDLGDKECREVHALKRKRSKVKERVMQKIMENAMRRVMKSDKEKVVKGVMSTVIVTGRRVVKCMQGGRRKGHAKEYREAEGRILTRGSEVVEEVIRVKVRERKSVSE